MRRSTTCTRSPTALSWGAPKLVDLRINNDARFPHLADDTYRILTTLYISPYSTTQNTLTLNFFSLHALALTLLSFSGRLRLAIAGRHLDTARPATGPFLFRALRTLHLRLARKQDVVLDMLSAHSSPCCRWMASFTTSGPSSWRASSRSLRATASQASSLAACQ